jgi:hypothetical protein
MALFSTMPLIAIRHGRNLIVTHDTRKAARGQSFYLWERA